MSEQTSLGAIQEGLQAYLNGEAGIAFEALVYFAEPLFQLYEVDLRADWEKAPSVREAEELAILLAVLETARLLWAYFALEEDGPRYRAALAERLLGPDSEADEQADLEALLRMMEAHWHTMDAGRRAAARVPGFALPPFEMLLAQYAPTADPGEPALGARRYGPEGLELPEALALFTRPLLEDRRVLEDPDVLESTLSRANAYWELAHAPAEEYRQRLASIKRLYARTPQEACRLEQEAARMVAHFFHLFPEQRSRPR